MKQALHEVIRSSFVKRLNRFQLSWATLLPNSFLVPDFLSHGDSEVASRQSPYEGKWRRLKL